MKRLAFIGWLIVSIGLWVVLILCINNFIFRNIWHRIPIEFYDAINDGVLWLVRKFKPDYDPGVLQADDPGLFVLFFAACTISAAIVFPVSVFAWRRILRPRLR